MKSRTTIATTICGALVLLAPGGVDAQEYPHRYMGGPGETTVAPSGAVVYDKVLDALGKVIYTEKTVEKIADGIWVIGGYSLVNCIVLDAPEGLIVYDTGDFTEEGKHFREVIEAQISKKPIKAIIYSHSHYAHGAGAMVDDPKSVTVIGHPKLNETIKANLQGGGAPSAIPELGPVLTARALVQFSNYLPESGPDATIAPKLQIRESAFLPVTQAVEDGQTMDVAGLKLQFFTEFISDDYSVTVWVPEKRAALNNFFWAGAVNLYSLRGAVYREPSIWRDGLRVVRDLQPEYLLNTHARPVKGQQEVSQALTNYMDLVSLTYDQTLRGILHGLGPDDLRYFIYQPKHLADPPYNAQVYGETPWFPPSIYQYQMGWYDNDATTLYQLPRVEESRRLVALMGGRDKVVAAAKDALAKKEYAWAAQLVNHAYVLDPRDPAARQVKIDALRKLGQLAISSIGRSFALTEARALEGTERVPRLIPPRPQLIAADPATFVNYHRVRIDPRKAEGVDRVLSFTFGDRTVGLHVRRGVVEYIDSMSKYSRKADIALAMDGDTWARLYLNQSGLDAEIKSGKATVTFGDAREAAQILALFDAYDPAGNVTVVRSPD